jgi:hypothetical protein
VDMAFGGVSLEVGSGIANTEGHVTSPHDSGRLMG